MIQFCSHRNNSAVVNEMLKKSLQVKTLSPACRHCFSFQTFFCRSLSTSPSPPLITLYCHRTQEDCRDTPSPVSRPVLGWAPEHLSRFLIYRIGCSGMFVMTNPPFRGRLDRDLTFTGAGVTKPPRSSGSEFENVTVYCIRRHRLTQRTSRGYSRMRRVTEQTSAVQLGPAELVSGLDFDSAD